VLTTINAAYQSVEMAYRSWHIAWRYKRSRTMEDIVRSKRLYLPDLQNGINFDAAYG
jgi:hypothetical protein